MEKTATLSPVQEDFFEKLRVIKRVQASLLNTDTKDGISWFQRDFKSKGINRLNDAVNLVLNDEKLMAIFNTQHEQWKANNALAKALIMLENAGGEYNYDSQRPEVKKQIDYLKTRTLNRIKKDNL